MAGQAKPNLEEMAKSGTAMSAPGMSYGCAEGDGFIAQVKAMWELFALESGLTGSYDDLPMYCGLVQAHSYSTLR